MQLFDLILRFLRTVPLKLGSVMQNLIPKVSDYF
jgi:hypothetical protein